MYYLYYVHEACISHLLFDICNLQIHSLSLLFYSFQLVRDKTSIETAAATLELKPQSFAYLGLGWEQNTEEQLQLKCPVAKHRYSATLCIWPNGHGLKILYWHVHYQYENNDNIYDKIWKGKYISILCDIISLTTRDTSLSVQKLSTFTYLKSSWILIKNTISKQLEWRVKRGREGRQQKQKQANSEWKPKV